jgi:AmmeMemoRadiSam system protein B/AmmeMemoRadiSam system protein A
MKSGAIVMLFSVLILPAAQCSTGQKRDAQPVEKILVNMEGDTLINRKPAVAGSFYPGNREELMQQLEKLLSNATPNKNLENIVAIISPHAGYVYSGLVAASVYNQLSPDTNYDNVFIIGSSHHASFNGAALYSEGNFITPLGIAKVNIALTRKLISDNPGLLSSLPDVHANEHSLEVQIPFLQYIYKSKLLIVPILLGTQNPATCKKIADALSPYIDGHNLFVISTDFSHYPDYQDACSIDEATAEAIVKNSSAEFMRTLKSNEDKGISNLATSICGWTSMLTFLDITEKNPGIHYHRIRYMNSGDGTVGDKDRVVGYNAIAITLDNGKVNNNTGNDYSLNTHEKEQLLHIARSTIKNYLETGQILQVDAEGFSEKLLSHSGAFLTLTEQGKLRGCIGRFIVDIPLYKVVQEMAISAATKDYRFNKLAKDELDKVEIEISVLTPMRKIQFPDEIVLGKHGIYIKKGNSTGTFLPQVATQTGWNIEEFLGHCSRDKAGIGWDGWKDAELFVYEAYVFGE